MNTKKITYSQVEVDYKALDAVKKLAQNAAKRTAKNLKKAGYSEVSDSRGESAFVWRQGDILMASVIEGLGTKNLIADGMGKLFTGKSYYRTIGYDTVATIINDLTTVGAKPLVIHAYWALEDNSWLGDKKRLKDFIYGWESACNAAGVTWGGGETPTLKGILKKDTVDLGGSAVGIIENPKNLIIDTKLEKGDRIILLRSNGINANGLSLARAIAEKLPKGFATKLNATYTYGDALLTETNIYANLIQKLLQEKAEIHYIVNITGHGFRKIMRARSPFTYVIENIFEPKEVFLFMQKHAGLSDEEAYGTWNMGMDYAIFLSKKDVKKAQKIIAQCGFESIDAGYIEKGKKQVIIKPKNITFSAETLDLR